MASIFFFFLLLLQLPALSLSKPQLPINIWPKPQNLSWPTPTSTTLSPSFSILSSSPLLQSAIAHFHLFTSQQIHIPILPPPPLHPSSPPLTTLNISISNPSSPLHHGIDESYTLSISSSSSSANLTAATPWGALHGLQTLSQLTWAVPNSPIVAVATDIVVNDWPDFSYRGVMLDTSRNYYPKRDVLRTIEAMAANKLNVFHWHVTDSHSFPIVLPSEKGLVEKGAYGEGMRYTEEDVREIVEFGLRRGVRVVPEIDMPGEFWV